MAGAGFGQAWGWPSGRSGGGTIVIDPQGGLINGPDGLLVDFNQQLLCIDGSLVYIGDGDILRRLEP